VNARRTIAVVGAGIAGAATARALAERGHHVELIEQGDPAFGVSGASLSCIGTHMMDADELPLLIWAGRAWAQAGARANIEYRRCGQLRFIDTPEERAAAERWIAIERAAGLEPQLLDNAGVRAIEPALEGTLLGASWSPGDALVNPFLAVRAFIAEARELGATLQPHRRVTGIATSGNAVTGVTTATGTIACDAVVLAAGPWTAQLAATAGVTLALIPRKAQCLATIAQPPTIGAVVGASKSSGGVDAGYTQIQQVTSGQILFNTVLAGGTTAAGDPDHPPVVDRVFVRDSVRMLLRLFPRLRGVELLRSWVRYEAVTPDDRFLAGAAGPDGLFIAAGDNGTGFVRAPAIARIIADQIDGVEPPFRADIYAPQRFNAADAA
jgi:glycine/D-amino acid oxidase-like deaminating enzyme